MDDVIQDIADLISQLNEKENASLYDYVDTIQQIEFVLIAAGVDTEPHVKGG